MCSGVLRPDPPPIGPPAHAEGVCLGLVSDQSNRTRATTVNEVHQEGLAVHPTDCFR